MEQGVFIHTLAIGDETWGPIPLGRNKGFRKDREGNTIVTKPNFRFLSELSNKGNGININANNSEIGLKKLFKEISKIEKKEISDMVFTNYTDRFQMFLFLSLFFFLLEIFILGKRNNPLKNWNSRWES
jgi:Ca-activated chloride channel family protein